jgi:hypothetical protein
MTNSNDETKQSNNEPNHQTAEVGWSKSNPIQERSDLSTTKPKSWWKRKEVLGGCGLVILNVASSPLMATVNPWVFMVANVGLGVLTVTGILQGVEANNLKPTKENYKIGE